MKSNDLSNLFSAGVGSEKMPVLFIGHGSPMNAISFFNDKAIMGSLTMTSFRIG